MKPCIQCGTMLADDATYCTNCNAPQTKRFDDFEIKTPQSDTFLKVLCILTIVGAAFSIISVIATFAKGVALPIKGLENITYVSLGIAIAKLAAAILMLQKKLIGLYIYTGAAVASTAIQIYSVSLTADYMSSMLGGGGSTIAIISAAFTVVIALVFLLLYWLPVNRKLLS